MTQPDEDLLTIDDHLDPEVRDIEAPAEDMVEQATPADPADAPGAPVELRLPFEADEADVLEQSRIVQLEDDYR
jgi:hypothetical protein